MASVSGQPLPRDQIPLKSQHVFTCGSSPDPSTRRSYSMEDVFRSKRRGHLALVDHSDIVDRQGTAFPKPILRETISHTIQPETHDACNSNSLMLAPLLQDSVFMDGRTAGSDRVVFAWTNGALCGVLREEESSYKICHSITRASEAGVNGLETSQT